METQDDQLIEFFKKSGANDEQSKTMASQLKKRARQLSGQRGCTELEALEHLLKRILEAREA
ncbi:MAG: hypothetical protein O3C43_12965 [Verrucomicrobia bacterium]|nr:hypothetical protein [Verrucomicrobiota bacterium]MDA1067403.1 hypothetical protein [Verrucomicrobiota bacterium]